MNAAYIEVAPQIIEELLMLPQGNRITGVQWDAIRHVMKIRIDGPDMPEYQAGQPLPLVTPTYRRLGQDVELVSLGKTET